ncbi:MAG: hypothetical protein FWB86_05515 [Treponema sp.]|nr:hypothetical protein [Treponema sp.]MCL2250536.1 hypothetical protein [Treponema sp.]
MKISYLILISAFLIIFSCKGNPPHRFLPADQLPPPRTETKTDEKKSEATNNELTNEIIKEEILIKDDSKEDSDLIAEEPKENVKSVPAELEITQTRYEETGLEQSLPDQEEDTLSEISSANELKSIEDLIASHQNNDLDQNPNIQDLLSSPFVQDETLLQEQATQVQTQPQAQQQTLAQTQPQVQQQQPAQQQAQPQAQTQPQAQQQQPAQQQAQPQTPAQTQPQAQQQQSAQQQTQPQQVRPQPVQPAVIEQPQAALAVQEEAKETETQPETPSAERLIPPFRNEFPSAPSARIEPAEGGIVFSRIIRVTVGQIIEIPFRGNGWVFLGELASRRGIVYNSRRSEQEGMSFIFSVEEPGTFTLKFYKEDFTRGYIINDYVQIIAGEAAASATGWFNSPFDRSRVIAEPRWPSAIEEAEMQKRLESGRTARPSETAVFTPTQSPQTATPSSERTLPSQQTATQQSASQTASAQEVRQNAAEPVVSAQTSERTETRNIQETSPAVSETQEVIAPNMLLQKAKETFDAGNASGAITLLDQYMTHYPNGSDEVYWLLGQYYEANTPSRNILLSLDYYKRLVNEYPQSTRLSDARRRIAYLERFYINIQ